MTVFELLEKQQELEASLDNLREQLDETKQRIPQLKFQQRQAQEAQLNAGVLKAFWNRLAGKEDPQEDLQRQVRIAAASLEAARREQASLEKQLSLLQQELDSLEDPEALAPSLDPQELAKYHRRKAALHAERALHLLHKCAKELEQAQYLARNPMMQVGDGYRENIHKENAGALAGQCREQLEQICQCGFPFPIHAYLQNPMGYLVTARSYGDQDQMNHAQNALRQTQAALKELLLQLAE